MTMRRKSSTEDKSSNDPTLERLMSDLDRMGQTSRAASLPPQQETQIRQALQQRATPPEQYRGTIARFQAPFRRHRPLALLVAVALSVLVLIGATYAAAPVLTRVFDVGGASAVIQQNLGTPVNLSRTLAGYTVTIERIYADSNRVLIAYSIRPPTSGKRLWNMSTNLGVTDAQGTILPERSLVGEVGGADPETTLMGFDTAAIGGSPSRLRLHLRIPWIEAMQQLHAPPAPGSSSMQAFRRLPTSGAFGSTAVARPAGERDPWMQIVRTYGPLSFDVTVPVEPGRESTPRQQVQGGGVTATLERVIISPTETRLYVSGLDPNTVGSLSSGSGSNDAAGSQWRWHGMTVFSYYADFMDRHGEWSFAIKPGPLLHLPPGVPPPPGSEPARGGPWAFHFTVP